MVGRYVQGPEGRIWGASGGFPAEGVVSSGAGSAAGGGRSGASGRLADTVHPAPDPASQNWIWIHLKIITSWMSYILDPYWFSPSGSRRGNWRPWSGNTIRFRNFNSFEFDIYWRGCDSSWYMEALKKDLRDTVKQFETNIFFTFEFKYDFWS